jgi:hypothetical protein
MALRLVRCLLYAVFDSDSEHKWLLLIQTPPSYKLNPITLGTSTRQNSVMVEVVGVTKGLRTVEKTGRLDDLLLSVVDETMRQIFRDAGTKVIYDYLANNSHLKREEIAEKPEVFSAGLERLMVSAARVIENLILKNLYSRLGLKFEEKEGYGFSDYVKKLRERFGR